jgi:hypothetical protein
MIYIYACGWHRPTVFTDLTAAKQFVEEENCVDDVQNNKWYEHSDRWILSVRWKSDLAILWKSQIPAATV